MTEEVDFIYKGVVTKIQCKEDEYMKDIISRFKVKINNHSIICMYNGIKIDENKKLNEINNNNIMNILVFDYESEGKTQFKQSKDIICPICYENCLMEINNYKIKLYGCDNNHITDNILFSEFKDTQKIDLSKIKCNQCNKSMIDINNNQLFICSQCDINLCPLCKSSHNKEHKFINYDMKNYVCKLHNEKYISYCNNCHKKLCLICGLDHKKEHKLIYNKDIEIYNGTKNNFDKIINELNELINKIQYIINNIKIYSDIYNNINLENTNYQKLKNKNYLYIWIKEILKDLDTISIDDNVNKIYTKMSTKNIINEEAATMFKTINDKIEIDNDLEKKRPAIRPLRPTTAYFLFIKARRPSLIKEYPELKNIEIFKALSEEWKNLTDMQKKPYIDKAEDDKKRYEREMEEYEANINK